MTFLLPIGLLALLALPLIVLLHLIRRRRVRQRVPSLELWRSLQSTTTERKPRRLLLTLLLFLHLLLAALLAVALGQPLLRIARGRATHLAIIADTSTSMAATDGQPRRLDDAKRAARELLAQLQRGDRATLIELQAEPAVLAQANGPDTTVLQQQLDGLEAGGPDGDLDRALALAQSTAQPHMATRVVVLTDLALAATTQQPVAGQAEWRTFGGEANNTAIVAFGAHLLRSGGHQLYARVANYGTAPIARTLTLTLDGTEVASEPVRLDGNGSAEWSWPLPASATRASATLSDNDVQPLDDRADAVLNGSAQQRVLLVSDGAIALERALRAQPNVNIEAIAPANYASRSDVDLHIFAGYLPPTLPPTPVLVVAPPTDQQLVEVGAEQFGLEVDQVADQRFGVLDWRPLQFRRVAQLGVPAWADVAVAAGDTPLVLAGQRDAQSVVIWAFDPDDTNLANRIQFPLLTSATVAMLVPQSGATFAIGERAPVTLRAANGVTFVAGDRITQPGVYETANGAVAVNALNEREAQLRSRPAPQIQTVAQSVDPGEATGRELWQPLVGAALAVLVAEWGYVNWTRRRPRRRAGGAA